MARSADAVASNLLVDVLVGREVSLERTASTTSAKNNEPSVIPRIARATPTHLAHAEAFSRCAACAPGSAIQVQANQSEADRAFKSPGTGSSPASPDRIIRAGGLGGFLK
eukprot:CAMPEP_0180112388 /NCGR_PEP_ID=MMETSP0985-20121206/36184_1 /TAXON_ID=483367 /ORGANISM="non described non described, Strain CCMP 2436" /LENGTH=109 /DNA_ID=CAMNT_0022050745 /DNA_START=205 /DNA_END=534 /DNA_ORIENTATION=+